MSPDKKQSGRQNLSKQEKVRKTLDSVKADDKKVKRSDNGKEA